MRARVSAIDILQPEEMTQSDRGMYAILTREYAKVGPKYTLEQAKASIEGPFWQVAFEAYAMQCGRIERLLIMMLQSNAPFHEGTQITIRPDHPEAEDWDGYVTEFRTTMIEATRHVMLEVSLNAGEASYHLPEFTELKDDIGM